MKQRVFNNLERISEQLDKEYGKIVQKLLAIAFCSMGARRVIERAIQGIDLEVMLPDGRFIAIEVKTFQGSRFTLNEKDLEGLETQLNGGKDGAYLAVLGPRRIDELLLFKYSPKEIVAKTYTTVSLDCFRDIDLEDQIRKYFDEAVLLFSNEALAYRQRGLNRILHNFDCAELA